MNRHGNLRDVTTVQRSAIPTGPHLLFALCGHKSGRAGAGMRGNLMLRCAACNESKSEAREQQQLRAGFYHHEEKG